MLNINAKAMKVVREIIEDADALGCKVIKMDCGATLIDMGINCEGSWKAGVLFTRASMGDMSTVTLGEFRASAGTNTSISWDFVDCDGYWKRYNVEKISSRR